MSRLKTFSLIAFAAVTALAAFSQADALTVQKAYKQVAITIVVTPSPVAYAPMQPRVVAASTTARFARLVADPDAGPRRIASGPTWWDVAPGTMIAQTSAQPPAVPVQFNAKPDPNAMYLRVIQHTSSVNAPYGTTVIPCAFELYTFWPKTYTLTDWGADTVRSGAGTFPIENYPIASYLSWAVPDFSPTVTAYANQGGPGQTSWRGAAGQAQQHCVDLTLVVPNSQPAGSFDAVIQYNMYVTP